MAHIKLKENRDCSLCWKCMDKGDKAIEVNGLFYHKECLELIERPEFGMGEIIFNYQQRIVDQIRKFKNKYNLELTDKPKTTELLKESIDQLLDCYKNSNNIKYLKNKYEKHEGC